MKNEDEMIIVSLNTTKKIMLKYIKEIINAYGNIPILFRHNNKIHISGIAKQTIITDQEKKSDMTPHKEVKFIRKITLLDSKAIDVIFPESGFAILKSCDVSEKIRQEISSKNAHHFQEARKQSILDARGITLTMSEIQKRVEMEKQSL